MSGVRQLDTEAPVARRAGTAGRCGRDESENDNKRGEEEKARGREGRGRLRCDSEGLVGAVPGRCGTDGDEDTKPEGTTRPGGRCARWLRLLRRHSPWLR